MSKVHKAARAFAVLAVATVVAAFNSETVPADAGAATNTELATPTYHLEIGSPRPVAEVTVSNGRLYFRSNDEPHGSELWSSDGTPEGTSLVKDIVAGPDHAFPEGLSSVGGHLLFFANGGGGGSTDLWRTKGSAASTVRIRRNTTLVKYTSGVDHAIATAGDRLFYFAVDSTTDAALWTSDGTSSGTIKLRSVRPGWHHQNDHPDEMVAVGDTLFFVAEDDVHGQELWMSDGTPAGTRMVKEILPGFGHDIYTATYDGPNQLTAVGDTLYFRANDGVHGWELWKSDGTADGTVMVKDLRAGAESSIPYGSESELVAFDDAVYFRAHDGTASGHELWKSDGTAGGTVAVADIQATTAGQPAQLTIAGGTLYFTAYAPDGPRALWATDGTAGSTRKLSDLDPGGCGDPPSCHYIFGLWPAGDLLYFGARDDYDPIEGHLAVGDELWVTDGSAAGTSRVDTFSPVPRWDASFAEMTDFNGTLYLAARDGVFSEWLLTILPGPPTAPSCHGFPSTITGEGTINGTAGDDVIVGSDGADVINGRGGKDIICARGGNDVFLQGSKNDGTDVMDGQEGVDTVSYASRTAPVLVRLGNDKHPYGGEGGEHDATFDIENATGGQGPDEITGDNQANRIMGGGGNDTLWGWTGNDTVLGGEGDDRFVASIDYGADLISGQAGVDTADYSERDSSLTITLGGVAGDDGAAGEGDTLSTVENVLGGDGNDTITGNGSDNRLDGRSGNDLLTGNGGADALFGGWGGDTLKLRDGVRGNDIGDGGEGTDTASYDIGDVIINVP